MRGGIQIQTLTDQHYEAAVSLWHTCGLTRPWNDAQTDLKRAMRGPSSTVLAAVDKEQLAGTVMVGHDGHRAWVYYLAVLPERQRQGLGQALMTAAEHWAQAEGMPKLQFMVRQDNAAVIGFYESLGYTDQQVVVMGRRFSDDPDGEVPSVDASRVDASGVDASRVDASRVDASRVDDHVTTTLAQPGQ